MEISWTDFVIKEEVSERVKKDRNMLQTIKNQEG